LSSVRHLCIAATPAQSHINRETIKPLYPSRLIWDWAGVAGDAEMRTLLKDAAQRFTSRIAGVR